MNNKEIIGLSDKELVQEFKDTKMLLNKMKLNHKVSAIENPMLIRDTRRNLARMKTELVARKSAAK